MNASAAEAHKPLEGCIVKATHVVVAAVFALGLNHAAIAAEASVDEEPLPVSTLTRSEVLADLQLFQESGLAALNRGDRNDWYAPDFLRAEAKYAQLRASPRYAMLVKRIAEQRGESATTAQH